MLISPSEPPLLKELGKVSSAPEKLGADVLFTSPIFGSVGVQRKEITDLIASVADGRLERELGQMKSLGLAVLVIEGRLNWTVDGSLMSTSSWTLAQHRGLLWSVQSRGYWIGSTDGLTDTCSYISSFATWATKSRHNSLSTRPKAKGQWGFATNRDWALHLLQSFNGIGVEVAGRIYDHFGGVPIAWTVDERDLQQIPGIGATKADRLIASLAAPSTR